MNAKETTDTPTPVRVGRLNSLRGVRRELARLYEDARNGRVAPGAAAKLAYVLTCLNRSLELETIGERLDALEQGRQP